MGRRISENWQDAIARPSPLNIPAAIPPLARTRDKAAIIGFSHVGLHECPFDDDEWEIWGLNSGWWYPRDSQDRFRADRWFELHQMLAQTPEEIEAIRGCPVPIYLTDRPTPDIPNGVQFPIWLLDQRFGTDCPYACTFAYQIAFAIAMGFTTIGLFGVELQLGTIRERTVERASVAFWVGYAKGLGVKVVLPDHSGVTAHPYRYGFDYHREKDIVDIYQMETASIAANFFAKKIGRTFMDHHFPGISG